jgi:exonuclease 3'-5' domain-containing protein 1
MPPTGRAELPAPLVSRTGVSVSVVDTVAGVAALVDALSRAECLAVDGEGVSLGCAEGRLCVLQLVADTAPTAVFLLDVYALSEGTAFGTPGSDGVATLRSLLSSPTPVKLLWDCRSDAAQLFATAGLSLRGVEDLQLHHLAHQHFVGRPLASVGGLGAVLGRGGDARLTAEAKRRVASVKEEAQRLFAPEKGGGYAVWEARPLLPILVEYRRACDDG